MKKLVIYLSLILIISCRKYDDYEPWTYSQETQTEVRPWQDSYVYGGTLPYDTTNILTLVGTRWVLTKMQVGFVGSSPNDTINFITNNQYVINSDLTARNYRLSKIPSSPNYELTLYYFTPFGGMAYSANLGYYFIQDGVINNAEFKNITNTTNKVRAWFKKL